jgi:hypothetical protein
MAGLPEHFVVFGRKIPRTPEYTGSIESPNISSMPELYPEVCSRGHSSFFARFLDCDWICWKPIRFVSYINRYALT